MFDEATIKWLVGTGVGGILAAFIFQAYRKDAKWIQEELKGQTHLLMQVVKDVTVALTALKETLERDRDEDDRRRRR